MVRLAFAQHTLPTSHFSQDSEKGLRGWGQREYSEVDVVQRFTMTDCIFDRPLSVELLQWLARASLRQPEILSMAVRLWGILRSLYGNIDDNLYLDSLGDRFGYPQWRDRFFIDAPTHHRGDAIPALHAPNCPCTKNISDWLFDPDMGMSESEWQTNFERHYSVSRAEMDRILHPVAWVYNPASGQTQFQWKSKLKQHYKLSDKDFKRLGRVVLHPERELHKNRPFAVSRKTLKKDLKILIELGWLTFSDTDGEEKYQKVDRFPALATSDRARAKPPSEHGLTGDLVRTDLAEFFEQFSQPINEIQRFFLHLEYVIPGKLYSHIETLQTQLKDIWSQTTVLPIRLIYCSAKLHQQEVERLVYPVCICYYQRAPYLFAYGQLPKDKMQIGWYDYRLDRIQCLQPIAWNSTEIPTELKPFQTTPKLPEEVFDRLHEALGFEFYQPEREMLVWFDPYFYGNYIEGTERASKFRKLSHSQALKWAISAKQLRQIGDRLAELNALLKSRSSAESYYLCKYRFRDNNVIMRLRSWGPNVEVLFPLDLRDQMRSDLEKLGKRYLN